MTLSQLRYVIQIAEAGSFTRAATELNVAQPSLSRQVKLLEEELGVPLFHRDGRGVVPTAAGQELVRRAAMVFDYLYDLRKAVMTFRGQADGVVTVGILPLFGATVVPTLLLRCREHHPNLNVKIMVGMSNAVREWLISGRVDFGVLSPSAENRKFLKESPLATDHLNLVSAGDLPNGGKGSVTFAQALATKLIIPTPNNGIRAVIDRYARQNDLVVTPTLEVDSIEIIKGLILTGAGTTILPRFAIAREI